ncbi:MAG: hypothetical protein QM776_15545 [Rhodocyclaceae bacterium]
MNYRHIAVVSVMLFQSTWSCAAEPIVSADFPAANISKVILRAGNAADAKVIAGEASLSSVVISATAGGGAGGYHSPDPNWKETPASDWGMAFVARAFGSTLVISTKNETRYIHHHYFLEGIRIQVPPHIQVIREPRILKGDGSPDLSAP